MLGCLQDEVIIREDIAESTNTEIERFGRDNTSAEPFVYASVFNLSRRQHPRRRYDQHTDANRTGEDPVEPRLETLSYFG